MVPSPVVNSSLLASSGLKARRSPAGNRAFESTGFRFDPDARRSSNVGRELEDFDDAFSLQHLVL